MAKKSGGILLDPSMKASGGGPELTAGTPTIAASLPQKTIDRWIIFHKIPCRFFITFLVLVRIWRTRAFKSLACCNNQHQWLDLFHWKTYLPLELYLRRSICTFLYSSMCNLFDCVIVWSNLMWPWSRHNLFYATRTRSRNSDYS